MKYVPLQQQILTALVNLLAAGLNEQLLACEQAPLPAQAFAPVPPGDILGDTISVAWAGNRRAVGADRNHRLTVADRDRDILYLIEVWAFGPSDQAAQARALACEFGLEQLLDAPENRYLGGLCDQPVMLGDTRVLTAEDDHRAALIWHLAIPVTCHVRTTRPEHQL